MLPNILKAFAASLAPSLTLIYNTSLQQGILPPASSSSDVFSPSNYRPVSLTPILSKILERLVSSQLKHHLNDSLHDHQFGSRPNRSVSQLLTLAVNDWTLARVSSTTTSVAFIDIHKAFDKVKHQNLLMTLFEIGIAGAILR